MNGRINQALTVIAGDLDICVPVEAVTVEDGQCFTTPAMARGARSKWVPPTGTSAAQKRKRPP